MKKKLFAVCHLVEAMWNFTRRFCILFSVASFLSLMAHAQNTVFTYQGRVTSSGTNFTGAGQFKFALVTSTNFSSTATATANPPSGGFITIINVTFGGNGYATPPAVTISGGGGSGATATANISGGVVTSILVNNPGSGYSSTPTVTVAAPPPNISFTTYWSNDGTSVNGSEPAAAVNVSVNNGLFVAVLGETALPNMAALPAFVFAQLNLQLRIWFNDGVNGFGALNPPQNLTPSPYAIRALNANFAATATTAISANAVAATNITGPIPLSQLQGAVVANGQTNLNLTGTFSGNGGALSNLSANSIVLSSASTGVASWGNNQYGQRNAPTDLIDVSAVAAGISHSLALKSNGTVVAWGAGTIINPSNQVDSGQSIVPPGLVARAIGAGYLHSLALRFDGTVVAWGSGKTNDPANAQYGQSIVPPGLSGVKAISAGVVHSLALLSNSTVVAWGAGVTNDPNDQFQGGQSAVPPGLTNVIAVSGGYAHSLALRANGTVVAWGAGTTDVETNNVEYGQSIVPPGLANVIAIAAGAVHSLALKSDGTVVAWGAGLANTPTNGIHYGQSAVPAGLNNVVAISAGIYHSVALKADGTVVVWGSNQFGETNVPPGMNNVLALAPGSIAAHVLVIRPRSTAPVAWLNSDNTFNGNVQVNGAVQFSGSLAIGGDLTVSNGLRLHEKDLFFRKGTDEDNGLGWYGPDKLFGSFFSPDGPVLYGANGGALAVNAFNQHLPILTWTNANEARVGIGTTSPGARLSLGSGSANSKLLLRDDGNGAGIGLGNQSGQFRFHLSGNSFEFPEFSFFSGPNGTEVFSISDQGIVRMGPNTLYQVPGASENLRILRGRIAGNGNITTGTGFTASRTGTGAYTISFSPAFTGEPTVTATVLVTLGRSVTCGTVNSSSAQFRTWDVGGASAIDQDFGFIAIGPR